MQPRQSQYTIMIGYYNLRGKAQVPRLLCEYLGVKYEDKLFSLPEWGRYKTQKASDWSFSDLPFLKEGSFVVTDSVPICVYIINRFGSTELLGKNLQDSSIVDMYLWTIDLMSNVISINCKQKSPYQLAVFKHQQWQNNVFPRLLTIENAAEKGPWFLGYLTIIDFSIYELMRYMQFIFGKDAQSLPKLNTIKNSLAQLPPIAAYENSSRAITEWCPTRLLQQIEKPQAKKQTPRKDETRVQS